MASGRKAHRVAILTALAALWTGTMALGCESGGEVAILDLEPKVGHTQGDQPVKILGRNFRQDIGYSVYFGTQKAGAVTIYDDQTMVVTTPGNSPVGQVDVTIRADDGHAFRIAQGFEFKEMGGSVVQGLGESATGGKEKGNLAF